MPDGFRASWLSALGCLWILIGFFNISCVMWKAWSLHDIANLWLYTLCFMGLSLGTFTVVAGAFFIRRRPWARFGLECVCWLGIIGIPIALANEYRVYRAVLESGMSEAARFAESVNPWHWGPWVGWAFYAFSVWLFRSRNVRAAFSMHREA